MNSSPLSMVGLDPTTQWPGLVRRLEFGVCGKVWVVGSSPTMERYVQSKINLAEKLSTFSDYFSPRTLA